MILIGAHRFVAIGVVLRDDGGALYVNEYPLRHELLEYMGELARSIELPDTVSNFHDIGLSMRVMLSLNGFPINRRQHTTAIPKHPDPRLGGGGSSRRPCLVSESRPRCSQTQDSVTTHSAERSRSYSLHVAHGV